MSYFPIFLQMQEQKVLIVGGGTIAAQKLSALLQFTNDITLIAKEVGDETARLVEAHGLKLYRRAYEKGDILGFAIVIVATDTVSLQQAIFEESRPYRILVNAVDNTDYCDFIFPSVLQRGELMVAFSTQGASPAFTKQLRRYFEARIPEGVEAFLSEMRHLRKRLPKGRSRMAKFEKMVLSYFQEHFK